MSTRNVGIACGLTGLLVAMIAVLSRPAFSILCSFAIREFGRPSAARSFSGSECGHTATAVEQGEVEKPEHRAVGGTPGLLAGRGKGNPGRAKRKTPGAINETAEARD